MGGEDENTKIEICRLFLGLWRVFTKFPVGIILRGLCTGILCHNGDNHGRISLVKRSSL